MEKLISLIAILQVVFAVSVNSYEIYRFEPSVQKDSSNLKCLQFWSNGPLTHCKLMFETQALFYIGLQTKPEGIESSTEIQVIIESGHGKNEKFSIISDELRRNQYWSQDFDKNDASRIIFKITKDGKEVDLKDVENLIDFVEIRGHGLNSKPIQQNQENQENEKNQEIEPTSDEDEDVEVDEYDTFTDEPTTENTDEPSTTETISTTISTTTTQRISTTENPLGPERELDELDTELGSHWTSSCKFFTTTEEFIADNCISGSQPPAINSEGFWAPCTEPSCEIEYKNPDSEISNAQVNIYMDGGGKINPPVIAQGSGAFTKFQMFQDIKWTEANLIIPSSGQDGVLKITLTAENAGAIVILDKVKILGRSRLVVDDDNDTLLIVLLSVGSVVLVCVFAGGVFFYIRYKKEHKYDGKGNKGRPLDHYQTLTNYQDENNYGSSRRDRGGQINESYMYNDQLGGGRSRPVGQNVGQNLGQGQGPRQFQSQASQESNQYLPRFEPTGALPRIRLNETASMSTRSNLGGPSFRRTEQY